MTPSDSFLSHRLVTLALWAALTGCGGGSATPPPGMDSNGLPFDTTAPSLRIASSVVAGQAADGPVTFTFTFSEDVGSSFGEKDIVVSGGTMGAFTRLGATSATLVVTPPDDVAGTLEVSVPAGVVADGSGNAGTAAALSVAFDRVKAPTLVIRSDVAEGATASGNVNFSFSFSEDVGSTFDTADIVVNGGTKGVFTRQSASLANLVVAPTADAVGMIDVQVGVGTFSDAAGNRNVDAATMSQAFDTDTPPTVTISDDTAADLATGPVMFRFSFSKDIGTSFSADDIVVSGGSAGTFTLTSGTQASLLVLPPANGTGTLRVTVPAGAVVDKAGKGSTQAAVATQDYLTYADTVPPSLTISDNVPGAIASGPVTFRFSFSEDVGTTFSTSDITVAGGVKGVLTRVDAITASLVVTPPAQSVGTIVVSVPAGRYADASGNLNASATSAQQAFNTQVESGNTGTCTTAPCLDFAASGIGYLPFEGLVSAAQSADPVDSANKVAKFVKGPAGQPWAGATIYTRDSDKSVAPVGLGVNKLVSLRVFAEAAGQTMRIKIEKADDPAVSIEAEAVTTKAGAWETLSFDFGAPVAGAYDPCKTYNRISVFPQFSGISAPARDTTTYFDELKYSADPGTGGGPSCGEGLIDLVGGKFASSYVAAGNAWASAEGGDAIAYIDDSVATQYWWGGVAPPSDTAPANYYFGYGININAKPWGFGAAVKAPTNAAARVAQYAAFHIEVWGNPELMATRPNLTVLLIGPAIGGCSAVLQGNIAVLGTGAAAYTVPLSSFTLATPCAFGSASAALVGGVAEIHIQVLGDNVQYVTPADGLGNYANGLNIGPMTFLTSNGLKGQRRIQSKMVRSGPPRLRH